MIVPAGMVAALRSFDGLYGQDSFHYLDYSTGPLRDSLLALRPPPPLYWPPGYPLMIFAASLILGPTALTGQLVSLVSGGLVPGFTALLAREVWLPSSRPGSGERRQPGGSVLLVPALAGAIAALNGQLWQSSIVVMSDAPALALVVLGVWALARYGRLRRLGWLVLAAIALALAVLTRWGYALVAIPCTLYALAVLVRSDRRTALVHAGVAALAVGVILGPTLVPGVVALFGPQRESANFVGDLKIQSWDPRNALRREFITSDGVLRFRLPNGLYFLLAPAQPFFFTPLLAVFALPGVWAVVRRRALAPLFLLVGWAGLVYGFHAGAPWQNFRFLLAYLPPLAILIAIGVIEVARVAGARARPPVLAWTLAGVVWMVGSGAGLTRDFVERKQVDLTTVHWVEDQLPASARLLTFSLTGTFLHYSRIETLELYVLHPADLPGALASGRPTYLLLDVANVEDQWRGRPLADSYHWLRDGPTLAEQGVRQPYTLFRVGPAAQ